MDEYLLNIKILVGSLVTVQALVSNSNLVKYTTSGLPKHNQIIVATTICLPHHVSFDDLRTKLIMFE